MAGGGGDAKSVLQPGRNCLDIAHAGRVSVIVDAADYFHHVRQAMLNAEHRILLIGWDFDTRIPLERTRPGWEHGETLGSFLLALSRRKPRLAIDILKWDVGAVKMLFRGAALVTLIRWAMRRQITFKLDSAHPPGCSHHQKIVIIDGALAVCGGIDMTGDRWDTPEHRDEEPRRRRPNGKHYGPWHDVTMMMDGAAAAAVSKLGHDRWALATGRDLKPISDRADPWPDGLEPSFTDVDVALSRTRALYEDCPEIREIEALYLDLIASAKRFIYAENQYFTSRKIGEAIAKRMAEPDPPEIVLIGPLQADGWLEQVAMDAARVRLAQAIGKSDAGRRFRIYTPATAGGQPIYVHAKLMIVDDRVLRIGSSNMNNRSLGLDSECDATIESDDAETRATIAALRLRLLAEHLDVPVEALAGEIEAKGSMIAAIEALRGEGKTLNPLDLSAPGEVETFIADNELLDPEHADGFFEPLSQRGLFRRWRARFRQASGRKSGTER